MREEELALQLYEACEDMDAMDYMETKEQELEKIRQDLIRMRGTPLYQCIENLVQRM